MSRLQEAGMLLQTTNGQLWVVQEGEDNRVCSLQHLGLGNLEIMRSLARGDAGMLNCQGFLAAAARLPQETLGQATLAAALLGGSSRTLAGLPTFLDSAAAAIPGVPSLPRGVVRSGGSIQLAVAGSSGPSVFDLMHELRCYSAAGSGCPSIQADFAADASGGASPSLLAAALRSSGPGCSSPELWVRWGKTADDWCCFAVPGGGQQPSARCSCGYAGLGLLFCSHLAEAYRAYLAPGMGASICRRRSASVLDVSALELASSQLSVYELVPLLLATALYTGAGSVLHGLGLGASVWQAASPAAALQHAMPHKAAVAHTAAQESSLGSWQVTAAEGGSAVPLLEHAGSLLCPATAEGLWAAVALPDRLFGMPDHLKPATTGWLSCVELLQAAMLLQSVGHVQCSRHLLQEYLIAMSGPAIWRLCEPVPRNLLHRLWEGLLPAEERLAWWGQQSARASQRLCSAEYLDLLGQLLGPVAALQHVQAMLHVEEHTECLELAMWVVNSPAGTSYLSSHRDVLPALQNLGAGFPQELGNHSFAPGPRQDQLLNWLAKVQSKHLRGASGARHPGLCAGAAGGDSSQAGQPAALLLTAARSVARRLLDLPPAEAMRMYDQLIPDMQELVMAEAAAALQAHHLYHQIRPPRGRVLDAVLQAQQALQEREEPVQGAAGISAGLTSLPRPQRGPLQQPLQHSTEFSLSALLAAAAAGGSCEQAAALRVAASFNLIDMSKGGSGRTQISTLIKHLEKPCWNHLASLLDSCRHDPGLPGCGTLPMVLAAWQQLLSAARQHAVREANHPWPLPHKGVRARKDGKGEQRAASLLQAWVPALPIQLLTARLPGCLEASCAAAAAALEARRTSPPEALSLALSGVLSCCQLISECTWAAALSPEHAAAAAELQHGLQPRLLLHVVPVLLQAAQAASSDCDELENPLRVLRAYAPQGFLDVDWMPRLDWLAAAVLDPLLWPSPFEAPATAAGRSTARAPAQAAGPAAGGHSSLVALLPHLLTASAAAQHSKCPVLQGLFLVVLCRCLAAVSAAAEAPAAAQHSAHAALVHLLLSPAVAACLQPAVLCAEEGLRTAEGLFEAAVQAGRAGGAGSPDLGRLAYLAVNALASHARSSWSSPAALVHKGVHKASVERALQELDKHAGWQSSALCLLSCWLNAAQQEQAQAAERATESASGCGSSVNGPPSPMLVASTLTALLTIGMSPCVLEEAARLLRLLAQAHPPQLLLQCSSLPLLVHAAATGTYKSHAESAGALHAGSAGVPSHTAAYKSHTESAGGSSQHAGSRAASLQQQVEALLSQVQQAAADAGPAGAVALAMWQLWRERPPADIANSGRQGASPAVFTAASSGAAMPWDRLAAAAAILSGRHSGAGGGRTTAGMEQAAWQAEARMGTLLGYPDDVPYHGVHRGTYLGDFDPALHEHAEESDGSDSYDGGYDYAYDGWGSDRHSS